MNADELKELERLWRSEIERPRDMLAQRHALELITAVRDRDEHIKFLLWSLMQAGSGIYENAQAPGEWYVLYNTERGGIAKEDVPATLQDVLNSPEGQSWTRGGG